MLLVDVVGKTDNVAPEHIGATCVKVGVTFGFTTMVMFAVVAHCPALGVKVYVVVVVLVNAGLHVPVMLFVDVVGNAAKVAPEQMGATCVKVGTIAPVTVTILVRVNVQLFGAANPLFQV